MKNLWKKILAMLLIMGFCGAMIPKTYVLAEPKPVMYIKVTAEEVADFSGYLVVSFIDENGKKTNVELNRVNNFSSEKISLAQGHYTVASVFRDCEGEWVAEGLDTKYDFKQFGNNVNIEITINIRQAFPHSEEVVNNMESEEESTSIAVVTEDINKIVQGVSFDEAETVLQTFTDKAYSIVTSDFKTILDIMCNDTYKKIYLEDDETHTEDSWNDMTQYEKFCFYVLYAKPKREMFTGTLIKTLSDVEPRVKSAFAFGNAKNGEELNNAIIEVWEWEFKMLERTGEFVNIFDPYARFENGNIPIPTEKETLFSDQEKKELESISKAVSQELREEEPSSTRAGVLMAVILCVVACIVIVILVLSGKKKDTDKE